MSAEAAMAHGQTSTGLTDFELAEYLREREGQTVAMAPGQHGQMPGGEMRAGPTQMGTMAASQQGEMPGGEMRAGPTQMGSMAAGQQGDMPGGEMRAGPTQMGSMAAGQQGDMPGGDMRVGPQETQMTAMAPVGPGQTATRAIDAELAAYLRER